jgi:hypothetical protein
MKYVFVALTFFFPFSVKVTVSLPNLREYV